MKRRNRVIAFLLSLIMAIELLPAVYPQSTEREAFSMPQASVTSTEEAKILGEITELREENAKYFLTDKGTTVMAEYPVPVHYEEDGEWKEIDNSLCDSEDGNDLENKASKTKIKLSKKSNGSKLVSVKEGSYGISWNFKDAEKVDAEILRNETAESEDKTVVKNAVSYAVYKDIFKNTDVEYIITGKKIKENIILKSADAPDVFTYEFKANGLLAEKTENGDIRFYSEDGEFEYTFSVPVIYDGNGEVLDDFTLTLSGNKNKYQVTLTLSSDWLKSEERTYPVIVDPIVSSEYDREGHWETYLYEYYPNANHYYSYEHTNVGVDMTGKRIRTLFKLDNHPELLSSDRIVRAYLQLHTISVINSSSTTYGDNLVVGVYDMETDWNNSATWNTLWSADSNNGYNTTCMDYQTITADGIYKFDITKSAKKWYDSDFAENYGVLLRLVDESKTGVTNQVFFSSTDRLYNTQETYPWAIIEYRNTNGIESYYTYETVANGAGTAYINHYTGAVSFSHTDLSYSDNFGSVSIAHIYNSSLKANTTAAGKGMSINLFSKIVAAEENKPYDYIYTDGDGTDHYFYKVEDKEEWTDEDGLGMTYTKVEGTGGKISFADESYAEFSENGVLSKTVDSVGHTVSIEGTPISGTTEVKIDGLTVGTIIYSGGVISRIIDKYQRTTLYTYDENGYLIRITYPDGNYSEFSYDENGNMTEIYAPGDDGSRHKTEIGYTFIEGSYRGTSICSTAEGTTEKHGVSNIEYEYSQTKLTYTDESWLVCQFDEYGRTVCAYDSYGNASSGSYVSEHSAAKNNLASDTSYFKPAINYILNNTFSEGETMSLASTWEKHGNVVMGASEHPAFSTRARIEMTSWGDGFVKQNVKAPKGGTYTVSAHIRALNVTGKGAGIRVATSKGDTYYSELLTGTTSGYINSGYRRVSVTVTLDSDESIAEVYIGIFEGEGIAHVCAPTLIKGNAIGEISLNSNGSFELEKSGWITSGAEISTEVFSDGTKSLKITGNYLSSKYVYSEMELIGKKGDVYTFGGMAKANALPLSERGNYRSFSVELQLKNSETGEYEIVGVAQFNRQVDDWQYSSQTIKAPFYHGAARFVIRYEYQMGNAYFDDMFVIKGAQNTYSYDANGNLISSTDKAETESQFNYNGNNGLTALLNPDGSKFYYEYNDNNQLVGAVSNIGQKTDIKYDQNGNATETTVSAVGIENGALQYNKEYVFRFSSDGRLLTASEGSAVPQNSTGGDEQRFVLEYVSAERQKIRSVSTGKYLNFNLDGDSVILDNTGGLFHVAPVGNGVYQLRTYGSDISCGVISFDDDTVKEISMGSEWDEMAESRCHWILEYDVESDKITSSAGYSENGRKQTSTTDSRGNTSSTEYDSFDRVDSVISANGSKTEYFYNDLNDRLNSVSSGNSEINYTYNTDGSLKTVESPTSLYTFGQDLLGRSIYTKVGNRTLVNNYYDSRSRLSYITYGNGDRVGYTYNSKNQISSVQWDYSTRYSYKYDLEGRLIGVSGAHSDYSYSYDLIGRLTAFYGKGSHQGGYTYDNENRLERYISLVNDSGFLTQYTYDSKGLVTEVSSVAEGGNSVLSSTYRKTNEYDALGRIYKTVYNTEAPLEVTYSYLEGKDEGTTTTLVASVNVGGKLLSYSYDEVGNITEIKENGVLKESYVYDSLGQLIRENNVDNNATIVYNYDNGGNIISKTAYPYTIGDVTGEGSVITYTYGDSSWGDLLTAYNGETITYDGIGNPLSYRSGMSFEWEGGRKLTSFKTPNAVGEYAYNADGIRVYKEVNGNTTEYYLNGTQIDTEITNYGGVSRRVDYIYDENGSIYGFVVNNTDKYYYAKNLQGDVIGILDSTGATLVEYSYDAWGKATISYPGIDSQTETEKQARYLLGSNNPFRYRSYYFDVETGFYYLNTRYYDPEIGRFINADGLLNTGGIFGYNLFAYCGNDPVNKADPNGMWWIFKNDLFIRPWVKILEILRNPVLFTEAMKKHTGKRDGVVWPTVSTDVGCPFGKHDCSAHREKLHDGIDILATVRGVAGDAIYAPISGYLKIFPVGSDVGAGFGNWVLIQNDDYKIYLGHMNGFAPNLKEGYVEAGTFVGYMGNTGTKTTGVHLHYGVCNKKTGKFIDPYSLYR